MPDVSQPRTAAEIYFTMLETGAPSYAEALREMAEPGVLPAVFFCMAGKDRTGVFAALLLGLLGVPDEHIVADYALTAEVLEEIHERHRREVPGIDDQWARPPAGHLGRGPRARWRVCSRAVHDRYGTWPDYATSIGVTEQTLDPHDPHAAADRLRRKTQQSREEIVRWRARGLPSRGRGACACRACRWGRGASRR